MAERLAFLARTIVCATILLGALAIVAAAKKDPPSRPVDLNVANIKELQELPGIGAVTAQAILDFRKKSGPFHRIEDLLVIRGISPKKLEKMRPYLHIGAASGSVKPAPKPAAKPAASPVPKPPVVAKPTVPLSKPSASAPAKNAPASASQRQTRALNTP